MYSLTSHLLPLTSNSFFRPLNGIKKQEFNIIVRPKRTKALVFFFLNQIFCTFASG